MTTVTLRDAAVENFSQRANDLADRLQRGAEDLATLASRLTTGEWNTRIPHDGRTVGVLVHHVASMYPIEISITKGIAAGQAVTGLTFADVHKINAEHAAKFAGVSKEAAIELLRRNSEDAAAAIRALSDEELDRATTNSMYNDAPLTCQFFIEDHALRHSYHHLGGIKNALMRS